MIVVYIFIGYLFIFYFNLYLGKLFCTRNASIAKLGKIIFKKKNDELANSPFFKPIRESIKQRSIPKLASYIFVMITLKSLGFALMSIVLITPLILVFQGLAMGSLFIYYKSKEKHLDLLPIVTFWQLLSHCFAGALGTVIGLNWLFKTNLPLNNKYLVLVIILSLFTGIIAAYLESKMLLNQKNQQANY